MMTPRQEKHLEDIQVLFVRYVNQKYRAGAKEHGGNLFDMDELELLDNAIDECVDQFTYLVTLREKLAKG